jgi:class 3 adenylate cyclase
VLEPETRYARAGDASVAYQVFGDGPLDLIGAFGPASNVDLLWDLPAAARFWEHIGSFARVAIFDRRGTGLSDPLGERPMLEQQVEDLRAVADAAGMRRPALLMSSAATSMGAMFAATHPERTAALVLWAAAALGGTILDPAARQVILDEIEKGWGEGRLLEIYAPGLIDDQRFRHWFRRYERGSVSPGMARRFVDLALQVDLTDVLPTIQAPTIVMHRRGDRMVPISDGRRVAELIPGARFVEFEGDNHFPYMEGSDVFIDEVEEFLTGVRRGHDVDRVLATVLFTDIVGSTELAARLGDRSWRDTLEAHEALVAKELDRFRGRAVKSTGDGVLATFDGPARAVRCARELTTAAPRRLGVELRAGVHTGEIELIGDDVGGIAVHIGARVSAMAGAGEVLASSTVKDLVAGSGIDFEDRGAHTLRGVPGEWRVYAVS